MNDDLKSWDRGAAKYLQQISGSTDNYKKFVDTIRTINLYWTLSELPDGE